MKSLLPLFLMFVSLTCEAQTWTMNECMNYAVRMSYNTRRADRALRTAGQDYTAAIGRHLPQLRASVGADASFGRGINPQTNTYDVMTTFSNGYGANMSIPIFNAFSYLNYTLKSKVSVARAQSELEKAQDDIALKVMSQYIDVLYNQGLVDLTEKRVETFRKDLQLAERKGELGTSSAADIAQFASSLAGEELSLIKYRNQLRTSVLNLKDIMNFPIEDTLTVDTGIIPVERKFESASTIFDAAGTYLPQMDILKKTLQVEKHQLNIAKSAYYPSISLSGGISTNYNKRLWTEGDKSTKFPTQFKDNMGEFMSVNMSIPIFQGLSIRTSVHKAKIAYEAAQSDFSEQLRALRIEIEQAVMDLEAAQSSVAGAEKAVEASKLSYRATERKYEQGMVSVIELQTSNNEYLRNQVELLSARLRYEILSRQVAYFSGEPLVSETKN